MAKDSEQPTDYVTQSQWAEGMDMIKGFFEKLVSELQHSTKRIDHIEIELKEFRTEQRQTNKEMAQNIEMNTNAITGLTQELREVKKLEFDVYDHEQRITKLEKTRV